MIYAMLVSIKTRLPPTSLPFKAQVTELNGDFIWRDICFEKYITARALEFNTRMLSAGMVVNL